MNFLIDHVLQHQEVVLLAAIAAVVLTKSVLQLVASRNYRKAAKDLVEARRLRLMRE
jgi:adenylate kinase